MSPMANTATPTPTTIKYNVWLLSVANSHHYRYHHHHHHAILHVLDKSVKYVTECVLPDVAYSRLSLTGREGRPLRCPKLCGAFLRPAPPHHQYRQLDIQASTQAGRCSCVHSMPAYSRLFGRTHLLHTLHVSYALHVEPLKFCFS